jgi:hypothetical protein
VTQIVMPDPRAVYLVDVLNDLFPDHGGWTYSGEIGDYIGRFIRMGKDGYWINGLFIKCVNYGVVTIMLELFEFFEGIAIRLVANNGTAGIWSFLDLGNDEDVRATLGNLIDE